MSRGKLAYKVSTSAVPFTYKLREIWLSMFWDTSLNLYLNTQERKPGATKLCSKTAIVVDYLILFSYEKSFGQICQENKRNHLTCFLEQSISQEFKRWRGREAIRGHRGTQGFTGEAASAPTPTGTDKGDGTATWPTRAGHLAKPGGTTELQIKIQGAAQSRARRRNLPWLPSSNQPPNSQCSLAASPHLARSLHQPQETHGTGVSWLGATQLRILRKEICPI